MIKSIGKGALAHTLSIRHGDAGSLQAAENELGRILLSLGQAVFEFESAQKKSKKSRLEICIEPGLLNAATLKSVSKILERLVTFVLLSQTSISFHPSSDEYQTAAKGMSRKSKYVALFSGGVDSLSGALLASEKSTSIVNVFCSHMYQGRVISVTRKLSERYFSNKGIDLYEFPVPVMDTTGYSQTRGFLYILTAAAIGVSVGARRIVVSECGPTMHQPKFGPADQTTMTTHPFVLARAQEILDLITPQLAISTPFENLTKAEVMAVCPKPRAFKESHSCISQRLVLHDGTCYGCVVRLLAGIAAGVPDVDYAHDPTTSTTANAGNLLALLDFSLNYLSAPDQLPSYQREPMEDFGKGDLFRRFALDNFAALYRLRRRRVILTPTVDRIYRQALRVLGGIAPLSGRLGELREMRRKPPKIVF